MGQCCSEIYKGCLWLFYLFIWLPGVLVAACGLNRSVACGILVPRMTRDRTRVPCTGRWILNHWTTKEVLVCVCVCMLVVQLCPTLCDPMDSSPPGSSVHGDSPGKNTGVGYHALLQGILPTQGSNPGLLHCRRILYHLRYQGSPRKSLQGC